LFLALKFLTTRIVHDRLDAVLDPDVIADSRVPEYRRQRLFPSLTPIIQ
jgi:hypothetical protein